MIRIINIITRLEFGGPPILIIDIIQRLNKEDFRSTIATGFTPDSKYDMIESARDKGIEVFTIPSLVRDINPLKDTIALIDLYLLLKRKKFDVIHCHTSKGGFVGRIAAKLAGANVIVYSPHGDIFEGYFNKIVTMAFAMLEKFAAYFTDTIVTLSKLGKERFLNHGVGKDSQIKPIYNGIDFKKFECIKVSSSDKRKELGLQDGDFICTTVARFVPVKGHTYLIKAVLEVIKVIPDAKFLFVGDGELMPSLQKEIESLGLKHNIILPGASEDIAEILNCSDVFVLPSVNEGFGIVLVEAMAMKKPLIATNVGGIPEIVIDGKTGILVPPESPEALSASIIKLHNNPDMRIEMGRAGYYRAKELFDIETTVHEFEKLYTELVKKKSGPSQNQRTRKLGTKKLIE